MELLLFWVKAPRHPGEEGVVVFIAVLELKTLKENHKVGPRKFKPRRKLQVDLRVEESKGLRMLEMEHLGCLLCTVNHDVDLGVGEWQDVIGIRGRFYGRCV